MSNIEEAEGSYKVYLAIKSDNKLNDKFSCTRDGVQYYKGKKMTEPDFSEVSVYLAQKYRVVSSKEELKSGIMAASKKIEPQLIYGTNLPDEFRDKVREYLEMNPPSYRRYDITTDAVAEFVDPAGWEEQQRLTEMKIAKALKEQGLQKVRVTYKGERKMRWFPIDGA
jgi:phosphoenolpyruvate synthase/pyruvate phosphate dikinase